MISWKRLLAGDESAKKIKQLRPLVEAVNRREGECAALEAGAFREKTAEFKTRRAGGESLEQLLPEAFALVREAAKRTLGQRHFDVQLMGGMILHERGIAEMRTGEGKTLVATLPVYLNALEEKGVHVITVNDYLARRDAVWMGQVYAALGLSVGVINSDGSYVYDSSYSEANQNSNAQTEKENDLDVQRDDLGGFKVVHEFLKPCERREAYEADITYGTNNEFGFDYLRDNIEYNPNELRQRGYHFAIVDEIDSILIDEARTPLIISAPAAESENLYKTFTEVAKKLNAGEHFEIDEKQKAITLTDAGIERAEQLLGIENIYTDRGIKYVHHLETAVRAKALFTKDKEYVVRDGQVVIVDEFTGRLQPSRRWSEGLHQAIEAKEGLDIQRESRTFASVTFQNYFRMYEKLAGMTGTAMTSSEEFYKVYGLSTIAVPTNVEVQRIDHNDLIFQTEQGKFTALARFVKELNDKGQPVLIGTVSIEKNELLSAFLKREGIPHEVLNAKNHEREGEIIAQAGRRGAVTIATNMAGRGVDIKLGGNPATDEQYEEVKRFGGLFVIGTERHEARRIDNQLRGRSGRQGDPGATQFFVSLEDTLMRVFASDTIKGMMGRFGIPEDEPIQNKLISRSLESAQTKIEGFNFDARKHILAYDDVLNRQRQSVYARRQKILIGEHADLDTVIEDIRAHVDQGALDKMVAEKKEALGEEAFYEALRRMLLQAVDTLWVEHLEVMDYMRSSVNLRAYGQRDPLIEYRKEGLRLFSEMQDSFYALTTQMLPQLGVSAAPPPAPVPPPSALRAVHPQSRGIARAGAGAAAAGAAAAQPREKIGRNELVTITNGNETKEIKYKRAEPLLQEGWTLVKK